MWDDDRPSSIGHRPWSIDEAPNPEPRTQNENPEPQNLEPGTVQGQSGVRIIAGTLKGRRLAAPGWDGLRPTSDKLRETLFNVVAPRIEGARVLDAYAGTGAMGIEALSRGAAHVTFVDGDPRSLKLIEGNLQRCGVSNRY